ILCQHTARQNQWRCHRCSGGQEFTAVRVLCSRHGENSSMLEVNQPRPIPYRNQLRVQPLFNRLYVQNLRRSACMPHGNGLFKGANVEVPLWEGDVNTRVSECLI